MSAPLSDAEIAAITGRHAAAEGGGWHLNPEPWAEPGTVRTMTDGYPRTVGVFDFRGGQAEENRRFVLSAHDDVRQLLADRGRFADRAAMAARISELELALGSAVAWLRSVAIRVDASVQLDLGRLRAAADELAQVEWRGIRDGDGEAAELAVFRASYPEGSITLGTYRTRAAAMDHVHHTIANEENSTAQAIELRVIWRADDPEADEPEWECWLHDEDGADDKPTGYVVGPLAVAVAYDADGDE